MRKITCEIEDTFEVTRRDGSTAAIDTRKIPDHMFPDFIREGAEECVRDAAAGAPLNAFRDAHKGEDGTKDERSAWFKDDANADAIRAESQRLMEARIAQIYAGERRVARQSNVDPLDAFRVKAVRYVMNHADEVKDKAAAKRLAKLAADYKAIPATDQKERVAVLLAFAQAHAEQFDPMAETLRAEAEAERKRSMGLAVGFNIAVS